MATYSGWAYDETFKAAIDLNDYQYRFMIAGSVAGEVTVATTLGASVLGVLQNDPRPGEGAVVRLLGVSKVQADAGASPPTWGCFVKTGSTGLALHFGTATAGSLFAPGICLKTVSGGSATYTEVLLTPGAIKYVS